MTASETCWQLLCVRGEKGSAYLRYVAHFLGAAWSMQRMHLRRPAFGCV